MRRLNLDMLGVMVVATLVLVASLLNLDAPWIRSLLALPLALYGVGYAVGKLLVPGRSLGVPERFLLSLGLSLSVLILTGLLLHLLPGGLQLQNWALMLFLTSTTAAILVIFRRMLLEASGKLEDQAGTLASGGRMPMVPSHNWQANPLHVLMVSLSALMVTLSIGLAFRPAPYKAYQGYSLFWMAPDPSDNSQQIELGVRSMEFGPRSYRIELYDGGQLVKEWDQIRLEPKQLWTLRFDLDDYPPGKGPLEAYLYRVDRPGAPYRQVRLWPAASLNSPIIEGQRHKANRMISK